MALLNKSYLINFKPMIAGDHIMSTITLKSLQEQIDNLKTLVEAQADVIESLKDMANNQSSGRDRGPESEGSMTESDAIRVMLGDLRNASHKNAAIELKLSYGQIYSARKGYTFKKIYQRMIKGELDNSCDAPIEENQEIQSEGEA